jgi:hypothetical protein
VSYDSFLKRPVGGRGQWPVGGTLFAGAHWKIGSGWRMTMRFGAQVAYWLVAVAILTCIEYAASRPVAHTFSVGSLTAICVVAVTVMVCAPGILRRLLTPERRTAAIFAVALITGSLPILGAVYKYVDFSSPMTERLLNETIPQARDTANRFISKFCWNRDGNIDSDQCKLVRDAIPYLYSPASIRLGIGTIERVTSTAELDPRVRAPWYDLEALIPDKTLPPQLASFKVVIQYLNGIRSLQPPTLKQWVQAFGSGGLLILIWLLYNALLLQLQTIRTE